MKNKTPSFLNRRELLLLGVATPTLVLLPTFSFATIPPPPISIWYLLFIADGIYNLSNLRTIELPPSAGTCQNYTRSGVTIAVRANFTFTGNWNYGAWQMMTGSPIYKWWEAYDKRTGRFVKLWEGERIEVYFADKSRVKVTFRGPHASYPFDPIVGTERLPDGKRLNGRTGTDRPADGRKSRDEGGGGSGLITPIIPSVGMYSRGHATQTLPW